MTFKALSPRLLGDHDANEALLLAQIKSILESHEMAHVFSQCEQTGGLFLVRTEVPQIDLIRRRN